MAVGKHNCRLIFHIVRVVVFFQSGMGIYEKVGGYGCRSTLNRGWLVTGRDLLKFTASPYHLKMLRLE